MKLLYPEFLWALCLLLIPLIIHLFNFRRYKTLYFSSLKFIKHVDQSSNSTRNLRHLFVLLLRMLAFISLVLAFAHPYIPQGESQDRGGKPLIAIYLDNSNSMTLLGSEGELLSEARETARRIIEDAPADAAFLLCTNELSGVEQHFVSKMDALDRLDRIEPAALTRQLGDVLSWQHDALENFAAQEGKPGKRQYIVLSDFQEATAGLSEFRADSSAAYIPLRFVAEKEENVAVDTVWFASPVHQQGQSSELLVRLHNWSDEDLVNRELHIECGTIQRDLYVDLPANETVQTSIAFTENATGMVQGTVSVRDEQVTFDDTWYFTYEVRKHLNVLLLNGPDAVPNAATVYRLDPFYKLTEVAQEAFTRDRLDGTDLVVLNGFNTLPSGEADALYEFVSGGGALALFPGTSISTDQFSPWLSKLGLPPLGTLVKEGVALKNIAYEDPFFKGVFEKRPQNLNLPALTAVYATYGNSPAVPLISMQNGGTLLYRTSGDLKAWLFTSSLKPEFGNFTANALFPGVLLRMGELSQRNSPESIVIGSDARFPVTDPTRSEQAVRIRNGSVEFIPQSVRSGNRTYLSLAGKEASGVLDAGVYSVFREKDTLGYMALNYDRAESNIRSMPEDEIVSQMKARGADHVSLKQVRYGSGAAGIDLESEQALWKWFLLLALFCLLVEMFFLKFYLK